MKTTCKKSTKALSVFLSVLMLFSCFSIGLTAFAEGPDATILDYGECGEHLTWVLTTDGTLTISGYGDMTDFPSEAPWYEKCNSIKEIVLPHGLTGIGNYAFGECRNLQSVNIPDGVTRIGDGAFQRCYNLVSYTLPDTLTTIEKYAFFECHNLVSAVIPDSVTSIDEDVFRDCRNIKSISIGKNITANMLANICISSCSPDTILISNDNPYLEVVDENCIIEKNTSRICCGFNNSIIPSDGSIDTIGKKAFRYCSFTSIDLPDSITTIEESAFHFCQFIQSIVIPERTTYIGMKAFFGCEKLTSIAISDSVTYVGSSAFSQCLSLTSVILPNNLTDINSFVFFGCNNLTSITIPNSVTFIYNNAFTGCAKLASLTIPDSVQTIYENAFQDCTSLSSLYLGKNVSTLGGGFISGCKNLLPENIIISEDNPNFVMCGNCIIDTRTKTLVQGFSSSIIPADGSVTAIGNYAFSECENLVSIVIPDGITKIGTGAFNNCTNLTNVNISNSITSIYTQAFSGAGLVSVVIPSSIETLGECVFEYCKNLKQATIQCSLMNLSGTFTNCHNLETVTFADDVTIKNMTTGPNGGTFCNCENLTFIDLSNLQIEKLNNAFDGCTSLEQVALPTSITTIGQNCFRNCNNLNSVNIQDCSQLQTIGDRAFYNCESLTGTLELPNYETLIIGNDAFHKCGYAGGMDNMDTLFANYGEDYYHFSDDLVTGSNEYGSWSYNAIICNDCDTNLAKGWKYHSNEYGDIIFGDDDITPCVHGITYVQFVEGAETIPATCMQGESVPVQIICSECGKVLAEKYFEIGDPCDHKDGEVVITDYELDEATGNYVCELITYCGFGCGTEVKKETVIVYFVEGEDVTPEKDGIKVHYEDEAGNKYELTDDGFVSAGDLTIHYPGEPVHERDFRDDDAETYYFYLDTYCENCEEDEPPVKILLDEKKVELEYHPQLAPTTTANGHMEYFTKVDDETKVWLWNNTDKVYEPGEIEILYGGTITSASTVKVPIGKPYKLSFEYTGLAENPNFTFVSYSDSITIDENGYITANKYLANATVLIKQNSYITKTITVQPRYLIDKLCVKDEIIYAENFNGSYSWFDYADPVTGNKTSYVTDQNYMYLLNTRLTTEVSGDSIRLGSDFSVFSSNYYYLYPEKVGQTTVTITAENIPEDLTDDCVHTVTYTVIQIPSIINLDKGSTVNVLDYFDIPEGYDLAVESASSNDTSVATIDEDGNLTGIANGSTFITVNGQSISVQVNIPVTEFDCPESVVYVYGSYPNEIPILVNVDATDWNVNYEVLSAPTGTVPYLSTYNYMDVDDAIRTPDFDINAWKNLNYRDRKGIALRDEHGDRIGPGEYVIKVWPNNNINLAKEITINVLPVTSPFEVIGEELFFNFKYDNDKHYFIAVDEDDNPLTFDNSPFENVGYMWTYETEDEPLVLGDNFTPCFEEGYCNITTSDISGDQWGYEGFAGIGLNLYGEKCIGLNEDKQLICLDGEYYEKGSTYGSNYYLGLYLVEDYTAPCDYDSLGEFIYKASEKATVLCDRDGNILTFDECPWSEGEIVNFQVYGESYEFVACEVSDLFAEMWNSEDGYPDYPVTSGEYYLTDIEELKYASEDEPAFAYFFFSNGKIYFSEMLGEEENPDDDIVDGCSQEVFIVSPVDYIIKLGIGEETPLDIFFGEYGLEKTPDETEFTTVGIVSLDDNLVLKGEKVGTTDLIVAVNADVPNATNDDVDSVVLTRTVHVEVVGLDADDLVLGEGETANVNAASDVEDPEFTYESSNEDVVTIDDDGEVTAVAPGVAEITVSDGEKDVVISVIVADVDVDAPKKVNVGKTDAITVDVLPADADYSVEYTVDDDDVLTVDDDGTVTGVTEGTAVVTVTVTVSNGDAEKEFVTTKTIEVVNHTPDAPVHENDVRDDEEGTYTFEVNTYCADDECDELLDSEDVVLELIPAVVATPEEDGHLEYFVNTDADDDTIYVWDGDSYEEGEIVTTKYVPQEDADVNEEGCKEHFEGSDDTNYVLDDENNYVPASDEDLVIPKIEVVPEEGSDPTVNTEGEKDHFVDPEGNKYLYDEEENKYVPASENDLRIEKIPVTPVNGKEPTVNEEGNIPYFVDEDGNIYTDLDEDGVYEDAEPEDVVIPKIEVTPVNGKDPTVNEKGNIPYFIDDENNPYTDKNNDGIYEPVLETSDLVIPKIPVVEHAYTKAVPETDGHTQYFTVAETYPQYEDYADKIYVIDPESGLYVEGEPEVLHYADALIWENIDKEPNCTETGIGDKVTYCVNCGEELSREADAEIPANGHTPLDAVEENRVEAKCEEDGGYDMVVRCNVCHDVISSEHYVIDALDHIWVEAGRSNEVAPTCTVAGGYDVTYECSECHKTKTEHITVAALGHKDTDKDGYCDVCGELAPGKGGTLVMGKGGSDIYYISTDKINWKSITGNNVISVPGIVYLKLADRDMNKGYKFVVNGSDVTFDEDGIATVVVNGPLVVTAVPVIVPDVKTSVSLIDRIIAFFKAIGDFFRNLFK